MTWNKIRETYVNNFKDFSIIIDSPCVSIQMRGKYIRLAMSCAVGVETSPLVTIDYEKKEVIVKR